jgi:hypothetical protein
VRLSFALWAAYLLILQPSIGTLDPSWPGPVPATKRRLQLKATGIAFASNPTSPTEQRQNDTPFALDSLVRKVPICILWNKAWAGELGNTVLYRVQPVDRHTIRVGYFAYWSTERPWGDNALTRWFVPALAIDAFYSHLLFVLPGAQRLLYGAGDVEGVRIMYHVRESSSLVPTSIVADDEGHREVAIDLSQAVDDTGRILLFNDVWSHQLGGRYALARARAGAERRCYQNEELRPLTSAVASTFRLGGPNDPRRAGPAWGAQ